MHCINRKKGERKWRGKDVGLVNLGGCIRLPVLTVVKNVKCHFSRLRDDQFIAANAFKSIGVHVSEWREEDVDSEVDPDSVAPERCTKQRVLTVAKSVRFHSDPEKADQSIVENVFRNIDGIKSSYK